MHRCVRASTFHRPQRRRLGRTRFFPRGAGRRPAPGRPRGPDTHRGRGAAASRSAGAAGSVGPGGVGGPRSGSADRASRDPPSSTVCPVCDSLSPCPSFVALRGRDEGPGRGSLPSPVATQRRGPPAPGGALTTHRSPVRWAFGARPRRPGARRERSKAGALPHRSVLARGQGGQPWKEPGLVSRNTHQGRARCGGRPCRLPAVVALPPLRCALGCPRAALTRWSPRIDVPH